MKMFELLPRPLGSIFRKLTHLTCNSPRDRAPTVPAKSQPPFIHPSNRNQSTRNARCDSFGGGRRLLLGEPSANTPYPLA